MTHSIDFIAERLEETPQKQIAAATRKGSNPRFERERCTREIKLALAPVRGRRIEPARQYDREKRRCDVWTIVDVLVLRAPLLSGWGAPSGQNHLGPASVESPRCAHRFRLRR